MVHGHHEYMDLLTYGKEAIRAQWKRAQDDHMAEFAGAQREHDALSSTQPERPPGPLLFSAARPELAGKLADDLASPRGFEPRLPP